MSVVLKCSKCGKPLEPAAIDKTKLWCPICADLKDLNGVNVLNNVMPAQDLIPSTLGGDDTMGLSNLQLRAAPNGQPAGAAKAFNVTVGDVSFVSHGRVDLTIGQTKVTIT